VERKIAPRPAAAPWPPLGIAWTVLTADGPASTSRRGRKRGDVVSQKQQHEPAPGQTHRELVVGESRRQSDRNSHLAVFTGTTAPADLTRSLSPAWTFWQTPLADGRGAMPERRRLAG
jgi:hypothetical protein